MSSSHIHGAPGKKREMWKRSFIPTPVQNNMSRPALLTKSETAEFERIVKCFADGKLRESTKDYINQNRWVLDQKVPEHFCLKHFMWENKCSCHPVSNLYIRRGRTFAFVVLLDRLKSKYKQCGKWLELVEFLHVSRLDVKHF